MDDNKKKIITLMSIILITTLLGGISGKYIKANLLNKYSSDIKSPIVKKNPEIKKEVKKEYANSYILINGIPLGNSSKNRNMLIALINNNLGTINFIPYNYYTGNKASPRLSELSNNNIKDFFVKKGLVITKQISIDQDNISNIYKEELKKIKEDSLPSIILKDQKGNSKTISLGNSITFYDLIKSNIRNKNDNNLEQLYLYIIKKMGDLNNPDLKIALANNKLDEFYNTKYKLELTEKDKIFTPIIFKAKKVLVDKEFQYLNVLKSGNFEGYKKQEFTNKEIKKLNGTYKMTLKEKLQAIRAKRANK